jgi:branched-chain amino acid transport system substrate-binding protein
VLPIMKVFDEQMRENGRKVVDSLIYNPEQPSYRAEVERVFGKKPRRCTASASCPTSSRS